MEANPQCQLMLEASPHHQLMLVMLILGSSAQASRAATDEWTRRRPCHTRLRAIWHHGHNQEQRRILNKQLTCWSPEGWKKSHLLIPGRVGSCLKLLLVLESSGKRERKEPLLRRKKDHYNHFRKDSWPPGWGFPWTGRKRWCGTESW